MENENGVETAHKILIGVTMLVAAVALIFFWVGGKDTTQRNGVVRGKVVSVSHIVNTHENGHYSFKVRSESGLVSTVDATGFVNHPEGIPKGWASSEEWISYQSV